jgi:hypothetical protein
MIMSKGRWCLVLFFTLLTFPYLDATAGTRITDRVPATSIDGTETVGIIQGGVDKKTTTSNLNKYDYKNKFVLQDDFITGTGASAQIGALGWGVSGGTATMQASTTADGGHPGLARLDTGAGAGTLARMMFETQTNALLALGSWSADMTWVMRLNQTNTNTMSRIGTGDDYTSDPPGTGVFFEKLNADTEWFCVTRQGASQTRVTSSVTTDTSFHTFRMNSTPAGVSFYIDGSAVCGGTFVATLPTTLTQPTVWIKNVDAASKTLDVDYFGIEVTGLVRP